jgi:hypothetical protein
MKALCYHENGTQINTDDTDCFDLAGCQKSQKGTWMESFFHKKEMMAWIDAAFFCFIRVNLLNLCSIQVL